MSKDKLRQSHTKTKIRLRRERRSSVISTTEMANVVGLSRRQYELKEKGVYPFLDYEMIAISEKLNIAVDELFF